MGWRGLDSVVREAAVLQADKPKSCDGGHSVNYRGLGGQSN
jgi:hypothetical protein